MEPENQVIAAAVTVEAAHAAAQGVRFETPDSPITQEIMPRRFKNWIVSDRELNTLGFLSAIETVIIAFLGISAGAALSLWITLKTITIEDVAIRANYFAAFLVSIGFTVILLVVSVIILISTFKDVSRIKTESEQEKRRREMIAQN